MMNLLQHHHHVYFNFKNPCIINQTDRGVLVSVSLRRESSERESVAARDRVIEFGKYKGKMLGSLPSRYLKWVCKNCRAGNFEEWGNLADKVLRDPIYRDRIEWELALNVLNGNNVNVNFSSSSSSSSELVDISERFGWDNLDKLGWAKVDFDLLGTSKGGRIPRRQHHPPPASQSLSQPQPQLRNTSTSTSTRRMERRERQKMRSKTEAEAHQQHMLVDDDDEDDKGQTQNQNGINANPFPGRQALLRKAINRRTRT
ncbi:uncharacterized protein LOC133301562 [Gastrolobium bilobum]|uniref:uncharacterized protein LOC133301562 n=1 Tax=Gastrolobium bilobum TaxID=150636 RepID=UPI002AB02DFC|nr:uncharacterized protein LOC133301562 [Gastrolobium bilobum]